MNIECKSYWVFNVIRPFREYHYFLTLWPWHWSFTHFLKTRPSGGYKQLWPYDLELDLLLKNFNLVKNFSTMSARVHSFHINICSSKVFPWVPTLFNPVTLTLEFDLFFNLSNNFWTVSARALIFYETRPSRWYQQFWPYDLDLGASPTFWKFLAMLRTFELWF